jgi:hypothetical protein
MAAGREYLIAVNHQDVTAARRAGREECRAGASRCRNLIDQPPQA